MLPCSCHILYMNFFRSPLSYFLHLVPRLALICFLPRISGDLGHKYLSVSSTFIPSIIHQFQIQPSVCIYLVIVLTSLLLSNEASIKASVIYYG